MRNPDCEMIVPGGIIYIPACCAEWANVGVFASDKSLFRKLALPNLERDKSEKRYYSELSFSQYDEIIRQNKPALLERIAKMNAPNYQVKTVTINP